MSLQPSQTFANHDRQLYALAGESATNWFKYPSQTGQVLLVDASGTQVLQSIDGNLFYNEELLAKAGDIQQISEWSNYPVLNPAGVDFNGNPLLNASTIEATGDISGGGNLTITGNVAADGSLAGSEVTVTGAIQGNSLSVSGAAAVGSVASTGAVSGTTITGSGTVQGAGIVTTGGLDMANTAITRAASINLNNAGFAPYGQLTSPNGTQLLWNGANITTGAGGDVSQWANYNAVTTINANSNAITNAGTIGCGAVNATGTVSAPNMTVGGGTSGLLIAKSITSLAGASDPGMSITAYQGLNLTADASSIVISAGAVSGAGNITTTAAGTVTTTSTGGDINTVAYNSAAISTGNDISLTADAGLNPLYTSAINLTAQNGNGGQVNITANPGSVAAFGGKVSIVANGGTVYVPQPPPAPPIAVTVGGEIDIFANTGSGGLYTLTSAVKIAAAGVNSYAGAIPSIGSLAGYNFIYGTGGVSICAGLPASGVQFPGTTYIYGIGIPGTAGGVRLQSPQGIQMLSDTYIQNLYPLDGNGLTIQGRSLPTGYVTIKDVDGLTMTSAGHIRSDFINSLSGFSIFYEDNLSPLPGTGKGVYANFLKPTQATAPGAPNLLITNNPFLANTNYVDISGAGKIAFDATGTGALIGVQSINGAAWPPPTGDASLWSQYPQTSTLDSSGYGIINLSTINGQPVGDLTPAGWWAFPAAGNVDISANGLTQVASIGVLDNATIVSAGALGIFADTSGGNLTLSTNGGGNVNIGTGNAGDINIVTSGTGNEVTIGGDVVNLNATQGVRVAASLDMVGNNIIDVALLRGSLATDMTISTNGVGNLNLQSDTGAISATTNDIVSIVAAQGVNMTATTQNIGLNAGAGRIILKSPTIQMIGGATATGDVVSSSGTNNYSLNTIGALVGGISSGFRDATEFYVSSDGSDANVGSILSPYRTIQRAITQAELISSAALVCNINVASGHYTENLVFNKGYIILTGTLQSQTGNEVCEITGSISIAVAGASDIFNRQVTFQGFNITCGVGQAVTDTSTTPHTVSFQDCKCFVVNQFFVSTASAADMRLYLTNVEIQQTSAASALPVISTNVGQIELERVDINVTGNCSAVVVGGTSVLTRCSLSTLDANSTATTLLPLLSITSTTTATHSLGNVAFAFTSAVAKTATSAIYIASGIATAIIMLNNVFTLAGTASSTNFCIGYNGVGSPSIAGINNTSLNVNVLLPQTTSVQSGITQIQYTDIQPPGLATYSSTADQTIAVSGTPQALTYTTTQFNQGTTLAAGSRVYANAQGNYALSYSVELQHAGAGAVQIATTFLKKNGTTIANTGRQWSIPSGSTQLAAMAEFVVSLNAGDYVEVFFNGDTSLSANATAAAGALPAIPSVVFNIKQFR